MDDVTPVYTLSVDVGLNAREYYWTMELHGRMHVGSVCYLDADFVVVMIAVAVIAVIVEKIEGEDLQYADFGNERVNCTKSFERAV